MTSKTNWPDWLTVSQIAARQRAPSLNESGSWRRPNCYARRSQADSRTYEQTASKSAGPSSPVKPTTST